MPLDLGASRRGTDAGPSAFRIAGLAVAVEQLGYQVLPNIDIEVPSLESCTLDDPSARYKDDILKVCLKLAQQTQSSMQAGEMPLVVGGDHSIAMGTVAGVAAHLRSQQQKLGLIWFDAHGDMNRPETSPTGNVHGMPLAHLLGYGDPSLANLLGPGPVVAPEQVALIGIRDIDQLERDFIKASGIAAFTMRDIDELGMSEVSRQALEWVNQGTAGFHLSFDLDGCDPSVIPGTGTLAPGGASYRETHYLLEDCASDGRMLSMEIVELNPFLDHANLSAERAVGFVQSALGRRIL